MYFYELQYNKVLSSRQIYNTAQSRILVHRGMFKEMQIFTKYDTTNYICPHFVIQYSVHTKF